MKFPIHLEDKNLGYGASKNSCYLRQYVQIVIIRFNIPGRNTSKLKCRVPITVVVGFQDDGMHCHNFPSRIHAAPCRCRVCFPFVYARSCSLKLYCSNRSCISCFAIVSAINEEHVGRMHGVTRILAVQCRLAFSRPCSQWIHAFQLPAAH